MQKENKLYCAFLNIIKLTYVAYQDLEIYYKRLMDMRIEWYSHNQIFNICECNCWHPLDSQ